MNEALLSYAELCENITEKQIIETAKKIPTGMNDMATVANMLTHFNDLHNQLEIYMDLCAALNNTKAKNSETSESILLANNPQELLIAMNRRAAYIRTEVARSKAMDKLDKYNELVESILSEISDFCLDGEAPNFIFVTGETYHILADAHFNLMGRETASICPVPLDARYISTRPSGSLVVDRSKLKDVQKVAGLYVSIFNDRQFRNGKYCVTKIQLI